MPLSDSSAIAFRWFLIRIASLAEAISTSNTWYLASEGVAYTPWFVTDSDMK